MFSVIFGTQAPRLGVRRSGVDRRGRRGEARSAIPLPPIPSQSGGRTAAGEQEAQAEIQAFREEGGDPAFLPEETPLT